MEWGREIPTFILTPLVMFPEAHRDIPKNTFENYLFTFFNVTLYFEIIVDLYAVVRNNTEKMCILYPVFPSGNILQMYYINENIILNLARILTLIQSSDFIQICLGLPVLTCVHVFISVQFSHL